MADNQFVVTVANAFIRDRELDQMIAKCKTLINSSVNFSVEETEIHGGEFHKLLYVFNFNRQGQISLEDAKYNPAFLAISCGSTVQNKMSDVYKFEETVTLDGSGNGSVGTLPVANTKLYVQDSTTGTIQTVTPTGKNFSVPTLAGKTVFVTYQYNTSVDVLEIDGSSFPKTYELVIEHKVYDSTGHIATEQWIFPAFKPDGAIEIPLQSNTPITTKLNGKVLTDTFDKYAYKKTIPASISSIAYTQITADTTDVSLSLGGGDTYALTVYGLRGGSYAPSVLNNADLTFSALDTGVCTVDANGVITPIATGVTEVTITKGTLKDNINVEVIA